MATDFRIGSALQMGISNPKKFLAAFQAFLMINQAIALSVWMPQFLSGGHGRNIRHLPCVSRKTGEQGVCMFAYTCMKSNGTHLGTCIDRFYFGSCCKIEEKSDDSLVDNQINVRPMDNNQVSLSPHRPPNEQSTSLPNLLIDRYTVSSAETSTHSHAVTSPKIETTSPASSSRVPSDKTEVDSAQNLTTSTYSLSQSTEKIYVPIHSSLKPNKTENLSSSSGLFTTDGSSSSIFSELNRPTTQNQGSFESNLFISTTTPSYLLSTFQMVNNENVAAQNKTPSTVPAPGSSTSQTGTWTPIKQQGSTVSTTPKAKPSPTKTTTTTTTVTRPPVSITTRKPIRPTSGTTTKKPNKPVRPTTTTRKPPPTSAPTSRPSQSSKPTVPVKKPVSTTPINRVTTPKPTAPVKKPSQPVKKPVSSLPKPSTSKPTVTVKPTTSTTKKSTTGTSSSKPSTSVTSTTTTSRPTTTPEATSSTKRPTATFSTEMALTKPVTTSVPSTTTRPATLFATTTITLETETTTKKPSLVTGSHLTTFNYVSEEVKVTDRPTTAVTQSTIGNEISSSETVFGSIPEAQEEDTNVIFQQIGSTVARPESSTLSTSTKQNVTSVPFFPEATKPIPTKPPWIQIVQTTSKRPAVSATTAKTTTTTTSATTIDPVISMLPGVNTSDYNQVCGRRLFPQSRVVGGEKSTFGKWPWQISLRQWRTSTYLHKCGAALLNENWAITAAHCVENVPPSDLLLRLGEHDLSTEDEPFGFQERRVQIVASHPQFDPRTFEYDLALLRFYEPVKFQPNIIPVCVPEDSTNFVGQTAYVTGWGRLYEDGPLPSVLQEVSVPVINNTLCENMYRSAGYIEHIPEIFICAGWKKGGFDSCEGDSGGPMVIQRPDKRWLLAGVISWGIGCAEPNQPGVYTRISEFREWIHQILQF